MATSAAIALLELAARTLFELGEPPIFRPDPEIGFLAVPGTYRFNGRGIRYNAYSMRSEPFPRARTAPNELRVLVFGDSVVNGGLWTDDRALATTRLAASLRRRLAGPVVVGNISGGGWGPRNALAYARRFGWFDANAAVFVWSSHDHADVPGSPAVGRSAQLPTRRPTSALWYYLIAVAKPAAARALGIEPERLRGTLGPDAARARALSALCEAIRLATTSGVHAFVALNPTRHELGGRADPGLDLLRRTARGCGGDLVELGPAYADANSRGVRTHRDDIHLTDAGQAVLAAALEEALERGP